MNLDDELRRTFRHKPAPPDLADRVLARIAEGEAPGRLKPAPTYKDAPVPTSRDIGSSARMAIRGWLAAAAAVALVATGGARYYVYQQDVAYQQNVAEAERVQADIMVALQITGEKLALVQRKVEESQR